MVLGSCAAGDSDGSNYSGRVTAAAEAGPDGTDRWVVTVALEDARVVGAETVQVAFDDDEVACVDGTPVRPDQIESDATIAFVRVGDGVDTMSPPVIRGRSLAVSC